MTVRSFRQLLPLYLACYAIWLALAAMGIWLLFAMRPVLFDLAIWLRLNPWQVRALDNFSVIGIGCLAGRHPGAGAQPAPRRGKKPAVEPRGARVPDRGDTAGPVLCRAGADRLVTGVTRSLYPSRFYACGEQGIHPFRGGFLSCGQKSATKE